MATAKKTRKPAAEGAKLYDVLSRLEHDGELYEAGDQVQLDDQVAAELEPLRVVKPAAEKPAT
jgi:hypothetical protein